MILIRSISISEEPPTADSLGQQLETPKPHSLFYKLKYRFATYKNAREVQKEENTEVYPEKQIYHGQ